MYDIGPREVSEYLACQAPPIPKTPNTSAQSFMIVGKDFILPHLPERVIVAR